MSCIKIKISGCAASILCHVLSCQISDFSPDIQNSSHDISDTHFVLAEGNIVEWCFVFCFFRLKGICGTTVMTRKKSMPRWRSCGGNVIKRLNHWANKLWSFLSTIRPPASGNVSNPASLFRPWIPPEHIRVKRLNAEMIWSPSTCQTLFCSSSLSLLAFLWTRCCFTGKSSAT